jgi:hypothetical protein
MQQRSKIYEALNPKPLWRQTVAEKYVWMFGWLGECLGECLGSFEGVGEACQSGALLLILWTCRRAEDEEKLELGRVVGTGFSIPTSASTGDRLLNDPLDALSDEEPEDDEEEDDGEEEEEEDRLPEEVSFAMFGCLDDIPLMTWGWLRSTLIPNSWP